jgi:hypothetical protein
MDTADRFLQEVSHNDNDTADIARRLFEQAHADLVRCGSAQAAALQIHPALRNLAACYRKAQKDGHKIPSYLDAAIETAVALVNLGTNPYEERREAPRNQERRDGGGDIGPGGVALRPGT